ncbi:MAG: DUF4384 domain-containing protein [Gammaproteobacteria bacterium]|nr:DUF4384 domain-containing protein [Gammaproteobacteria bacterium]
MKRAELFESLPRLMIVIAVLSSVVSCAVNPLHTDLDLAQTTPEQNTTIFQDAIDKLGLMNEIYGAGELYVMPKYMTDNTGTSLPTRGEIPRDITEMVKSTLNSIGGGILYVPYDPEFMVNTAKTGYSDYAEKLLPHVIISGGITEFDRGLVTKGETIDADWNRSISSESYGIDFSNRKKHSLAKISLDFNLIDFKTFTGIPKMQTTNTIKVHKAVAENGLGFTVYGASFGLKGTVKKIQGRHGAVRLLVQASIIQLLGRHQNIPYWRLVPGAKADRFVMESITSKFYDFSPEQRIRNIQQLLYLHGYEIDPNGQLDQSTKQALHSFGLKHNIQADINGPTVRQLFEHIPVNYHSRSRQNRLDHIRVKLNNQNFSDSSLRLQEANSTIPVVVNDATKVDEQV